MVGSGRSCDTLRHTVIQGITSLCHLFVTCRSKRPIIPFVDHRLTMYFCKQGTSRIYFSNEVFHKFYLVGGSWFIAIQTWMKFGYRQNAYTLNSISHEKDRTKFILSYSSRQWQYGPLSSLQKKIPKSSIS